MNAVKALSKPVHEHILENIPQAAPFRFVDEILEVNDSKVVGTYTYREDEYFYRGHFPQNPVTPGVILTETMAQIGVLALGIYLADTYGFSQNKQVKAFLTSSDIRFREVVRPGEKVWVYGEKLVFKHNLLKCRVVMKKSDQKIACKGVMSGMFITGNS